MAEKLTVREQIAQEKVLKLEKEKKKEENKKKKLLLEKAQEKANLKLEKIAKKQRIELRDTVFKNCCEVMKECVGLFVSIEHKRPQWLQQYDVSGAIKFSRKLVPLNSKADPTEDRIAYLKVRETVIVKLLIETKGYSNGNCYIYASLAFYAPNKKKHNLWKDGSSNRRDALYIEFVCSSFVALDESLSVPPIFEEDDCSKIRNALVKFFGKIIVEDGKKQKEIEERLTKSKTKPAKVIEEEPVISEFQFIDLGEE